jgi:F0F1-type ATP synthase membrane subunit b/b'
MEIIASPDALRNLTPLVAVCVIFAGLLSVLMTAFLKHLDTKDKRIAEVVSQTQTVLQQIQKELTALAENARQSNAILQRLGLQVLRDESDRTERG